MHLCMMAYRSSVNETTQFIPSKMIMGRELRSPIDLLLGEPYEESTGQRLLERVSNLQYSMEYARIGAKSHFASK